jgi:DDE superfamily endonuclease
VRVPFHFTPTSASWLNQIEIVFSLLQRKTLTGASFKSKDQLRGLSKPSSKSTTSAPSRSAGVSARLKGSQLRNTNVNLCN